MTTVPSENILKLRELTEQICNGEHTDEYKNIVLKLKNILDEGAHEITKAKTIKSRVKCYESMCVTFTNLLNNVNIF